MFSPFLATIGAIFPFGLVMRRPPVVRVRRARPAPRGEGEPTGTVDASATGAAVTGPTEARALAHVEANVRARRSDPDDMCIVAYVPSDATPMHLRAHPRIRNPFRAFPRRGADLVSLMEVRAPDA